MLFPKYHCNEEKFHELWFTILTDAKEVWKQVHEARDNASGSPGHVESCNPIQKEILWYL